jgi:hypothetical protein
MQATVRRIFLTSVILLILLVNCRETDILRTIRNGDYSLITKGSYKGTADYNGQGENYTPAVKRCRRLIEKSIDLLPMITRHHFPAPGNLNFDFKMVLLDRTGNALVLRYYAPIFGDNIVAGYQLFFVFDLSRDELIRIFSSEVPLE